MRLFRTSGRHSGHKMKIIADTLDALHREEV